LIGLYLVTLMLFASYMALASASGSPLMASEHTPSPLLVEVMNYLDWFGLTAFVVRDLNWDISGCFQKTWLNRRMSTTTNRP